MRLDNVLIRLRDTRVYVDFEKKEVIREYQSKECEYEKVRQVRTLTQLRSRSDSFANTVLTPSPSV